MAEVLDLDLNSFDLEDVMSAPSNNNISGSSSGATKSVSISPVPSNTSRPVSVTAGNISRPPSNGPPPVSNLGNLDEEFGLDMLVDPGKITDSKPSVSPVQQSTTSSAPKTGGGNLFSNLFGSSNQSQPTTNKPASKGGLFGLGNTSTLDLDKELADLDAGLNANVNKATNLGANISRPPTSVGVAGPSLVGGGTSSMNMTYEEMERAKFNLLQKFESLKRKGVKVPVKFSMQSDYDEMKNEYEALENQRRMDISVKMQRTWLLNGVNLIEMLNTNYDPFDIELDGWGESINEDLLNGDYDDIFEELYEKYKGYGSYPPELRLIMGVVGSGFAFHIQKRMTAGLGLDGQRILRENPDIARQMRDATAKSARQQMPGLSNFMGLFNSGKGGPPPFPGPSSNDGIPDLNTVLNS